MSKRIQLVVNDEQHEKWKKVVEGEGEYEGEFPEIDSLSQLMRKGAETYIGSSGNQSGGDLNSADVDQIRENTERILTGLKEVDTEVKALRNENLKKREMESLIEATVGRVFQELFEQQLKTAFTVPAMLGSDEGDDDE